MEPYLIFLFALLAMSFVTFCFYAVDKSKARRGAWRVPERVLLSFSFFGGAIGGALAMKLCHHKTRHWYFIAVNAIGLLWQLALLAFLFSKA